MTRRPPNDRTLVAPGASSGGSARLPGVDERLAPPETRVEYLGGIELFAAPADAPHATQHSDLAYVLHAHVAKGYRSAVDMLTRTGEASDFAPDASVFAPKPGGGRKLEELAFEVSDKQALAVPTAKARELARRGVRRVFAIVVKHQRVLEWSRETDNWRTMPRGTLIDDACLLRPLPIDALLDAAAGDDAVAKALLAKGVPAIEGALAAHREEGREDGELQAAREAVLDVLAARGLPIAITIRKKIEACTDRSLLRTWHATAVTAANAAEATRKTR